MKNPIKDVTYWGPYGSIGDFLGRPPSVGNRGGNFQNASRRLPRARYRFYGKKETRNNRLGFRVVRNR